MTTTLAITLLLALASVASAARIPASKQAWQWRYQVWMPAHWQRLAQCEEHLNWRFSNGTYEGAFAFAATTWDAFRYDGYPRSAADATPWQQWRVARRIAAHFRSIAGSWGCWRGPEHAWVRGGLSERETWR